GLSPDGRLVEMIELPDHPYFVACQFHPELKSRPDNPHPLFVGLVAAAAGLPLPVGDESNAAVVKANHTALHQVVEAVLYYPFPWGRSQAGRSGVVRGLGKKPIELAFAQRSCSAIVHHCWWRRRCLDFVRAGLPLLKKRGVRHRPAQFGVEIT